MEPNSLKTGTTQTLQLDPSKQSQLKPTATVLKNRIGGGQTKLGGTKQLFQKSKQQQSATSDKDNQIVREGSDIVTPKILISAKLTQIAQEYLKLEQEEEKKADIMKRSASAMDSSVMQSADKSSGSDNKASSSGIKDSSFMESKKSDNTESEEESKQKSDGQEDKKQKKTKQLSEKELDELVTINLSETETQFLLFIPSSQVAHDNVKSQDIQNRNQKYELYLKERIGSDNYTNRQAQTFNYAAKFKETQSYRVEKNDQGVFASNWDIFDAQQQEQLTESQQLQEQIKKSIDKELNQKIKNPFCYLPTHKEAINLHMQQKVPGSQLQADAKNKKDMKTSNPYGTSKPAESSSINPTQQMDDTNKELSGQLRDVSGSKFKLAQETKQTKVTKMTKQTEQTMLKLKQDQDQLDNVEAEMIKKAIDQSKQQPTDEEIIVMGSQSLEKYLKYVDRILNQNTYHKQYILYRNYPEVKIEKQHYDDDHGKRGGIGGMGVMRMAMNKDQEEEKELNKKQEPLNYLFKFGCDLTKGRSVSYADWNPINQDLLAVSYGELELNVNKEGYIMFWTLKNPSYPERVIKYPTRVTCCKFSQSNPNLLAMGTYDGIIAIYDLRKKDNIPVAENREMVGDLHKEASKHSDAVWEVHWVGKGGKSSDKGEGLVSISSDGRIVEWSMKKGLEYTDLMNLKRSSNPQNKDVPNEGINFRQTAGFSLDFLKGESSMYLVATEDGAIHRCSKSYSEQYLDSYYGHSGPVYKVRCNPFWSDIFLSCSADWSAKLWNIKEENPIQNFQSLDLNDEVMDIDWSPYCSTLFASVCKDGRMELWDLEKNNMIDPFTDIKKEGLPSKTMVRFCQNAPVIATGDIDGDINCYRLFGYEDQDPKNQQDKLQKLLYPTGYLKGDKGEKIEENEG